MGTQSERNSVYKFKHMGMGKDHTLFALKDGRVKFSKGFKKRKFISVEETVAAAE